MTWNQNTALVSIKSGWGPLCIYIHTLLSERTISKYIITENLMPCPLFIICVYALRKKLASISLSICTQKKPMLFKTVEKKHYQEFSPAKEGLGRHM